MTRQDLPLYDFPYSQLYRDALDPDVREIVEHEDRARSISALQEHPVDLHPPRWVNGHWEFWENPENS